MNSPESTEEQTNNLLKKYLDSSGEADRMRYAKCSRIEESETDPLPDVSFYVVCEIAEPPSAEPIALSVAFGVRGQVEFSEVSRGGK